MWSIALSIISIIIGGFSLYYSYQAFSNTSKIQKALNKQIASEVIARVKKVMESNQMYLGSKDSANLYDPAIQVTQALASLLEIARDDKFLFDKDMIQKIESVRGELLLLCDDKMNEFSFGNIISTYQEIIAALSKMEAKHRAGIN